jgi:multiple sugar transport system substrate-binding protein
MRRLIPIILLLAFLAACRDAPGPEAIDTVPAVIQAEQVTITLAVESGSLNRYRPLLEAFEEENSHIRVRLVNTGEVAVPDESGIQALATSFDVFPYTPNRQGETQYLLDLRPLLDLDPQFDTADFLPGLLPPTTEPLWAIPIGAAYYLTFFDKSAFDEAGRPHPDLDWTADDFLDTALALTMREGDAVTRWGYVPGQMRYPPLLASQLAAPLTTADGGLRLADPDVATATQWLGDLFTVHEVSPWLEEYKPVERRSSSGGQTASALINSGQAAMWHFTHLLFDAGDENVGVTAVPRTEHGLAAEPIIYGFGVSRGTAQPEAAWQLLLFLSRQPPQEAMFSVGLVPARRSVGAANNYWEQLPDSLAPALQYTAENSTPPRIALPAANLLQEAVAAHIDDGIPIAIALDQSEAIASTLPAETDVEIVAAPTAPTNNEEEHIQITFANPGIFLEAHRLLVDQFQRENPDIRIHIEETTFEESLLNRITGSDCFAVWSGLDALTVNDDELRSVLLPMGPLLDLDTTIRPEAFYPDTLSALIVDGELMGLPAGVHIPYIEYNRRLFQEAGIPEPSMDWTLADFLEIARQLTTGEGESKQYGFADPYGDRLLRRGIEVFDIRLLDDSNTIPHLNYEAATEAISWYADLVRRHEVQPFLTVNGTPGFAQFETLFREERIAMWPGGAANYLHFMGTPFPNLDVGVAPEPLGPTSNRGSLSIDAYYIHVDSPHPAACWEWINFLITKPAATYARPQMVRLLPSHTETAESEEYVALVGAELAAVGQAYINAPVADSFSPLPAWMGYGRTWLFHAYFDVASGESDVATALAEAEAQFSQYRQCIIERDGFDDSAAWSACAVEAER